MKGYQKTARLIFRYIRQELKFGQERELKEWRGLSAENEAFFQQETSIEHIRARLLVHEESKIRILEKLQANFPPNWIEGAPRKPGIVIRLLKAAAIMIGILLVLLGGFIGYELFFNSASPQNFGMMVTVNGQRIMLNDFQLGLKAGLKGIKVNQKENGELLYTIPNNLKASKGQSDTLWTSERWRFEMRFPEGSDIWMNLSSTISYPRNFINADSVSYYVLGEAYFKIPGSTNKYYEIRTDSMVIRTTGAELDLRSNAGAGGPAVLMVSGNASFKLPGDTTRTVHLTPGQQVRLVDGKLVVDDHPDIKAITGWKK